MGVTGNNDFWNAVKPFLTSKGFLHNDDIAMNFDNRTITDDKELSKTFNIVLILYKILPVVPLLR